MTGHPEIEENSIGNSAELRLEERESRVHCQREDFVIASQRAKKMTLEQTKNKFRQINSINYQKR